MYGRTLRNSYSNSVEIVGVKCTLNSVANCTNCAFSGTEMPVELSIRTVLYNSTLVLGRSSDHFMEMNIRGKFAAQVSI